MSGDKKGRRRKAKGRASRKKPEQKKPVDLVESASLESLLNPVSPKEFYAKVEEAIVRIKELEDALATGSKGLRPGLREFIRQANRSYSKAIWDAQPKDEYGFTTVAEMDQYKSFDDFYNEFKAKAGDKGSRVTPEMVKALTPYKTELALIYESRTHQFGHLFHSEKTRRVGKRLDKNDVGKLREKPEKYQAFVDDIRAKYGEAWVRIIERMDLEGASEDEKKEFAEIKVKIEETLKIKAELEARIAVYEKEGAPTPGPSPAPVQGAFVCPYAGGAAGGAGTGEVYKELFGMMKELYAERFKGVYEKLDAIEKKLEEGYRGKAEEPKADYEKKEISPEETPGPPKDEDEGTLEGKVKEPAGKKKPEPQKDEKDEAKPKEDASDVLTKAYEMAKKARKAGDFEYALNLLGQVSQAGGIERQDLLYCEIGVNLLLAGDYETAGKYFLQALETSPSDITAKVAGHNLKFVCFLAGAEEQGARYSKLKGKTAGIEFYDFITGVRTESLAA